MRRGTRRSIQRLFVVDTSLTRRIGHWGSFQIGIIHPALPEIVNEEMQFEFRVGTMIVLRWQSNIKAVEYATITMDKTSCRLPLLFGIILCGFESDAVGVECVDSDDDSTE